MSRLNTERAAQQASLGRAARVELSPAAIADPYFLTIVIGTVRRYRAEPSLITLVFPPNDDPRAKRLADCLAACRFRVVSSDLPPSRAPQQGECTCAR